MWGLFSEQLVAFVAVFVLSVIAGPFIIPILRRLKFGQTVRDDGPVTHLKKMGVPTIGGLIFLIPILLVTGYFAKDYPEIKVLILVTAASALIGLIDDLIKVIRKSKDGLNPSQKTFGILVVSVSFAFYTSRHTGIGTEMIMPFMGLDKTIELPLWFYIPFITIVMYLIINSVNMTDGVDGLAAGVTIIVMVFFSIVAMTRSEWETVKIFSSAVAGGCLGFLVFNLHPARVFMGDTGSLALGGAVGAAAVIMKMPWILLLAGGIYAIESLSVFLQVTSFKLRGKRIFKMAPLHHHFELMGWKETKVVKVFWTVTLILCIVSLAVLRISFW
jgi:phospho-N-acetylmuramoyl-pentapeptide-transferase